ncbi:MAG: hypothetical protein SOU51_00805 [Collinsella sp.]|nr:hypothetical protein [Collinsella sp.]
MAEKSQGHRAIAIGLSGGIGLTIPLVAYVATLPFDGANGIVRASGLPFAIGALVGAGACAASLHLYRDTDDEPASTESDPKASEVEMDGQHTGFFGRHGAPKDVPVIARAVDALSEAEAWAEIDSLMSADSPISCDAATSKDIYQIAFEELARAAKPAPHAAPSTGEGMAAIAEMDAPAPFNTAVLDSRDLDLDEPSGVVCNQSPVPSESCPHLDDISTAPSSSVEAQEIPMADYTGHEDMWAEALAILAEESEEPAYRPAHIAGSASVERAKAVAEGRESTRMHSRVNEILGEEFDKVASQSVRRTSREYLRVIEGGTMSMSRLQVEA